MLSWSIYGISPVGNLVEDFVRAAQEREAKRERLEGDAMKADRKREAA